MAEPGPTDRVPGTRILVTGASIAGNALAWWLDRHGFDVTVVERAAAFRRGGQNIDVRGAGREVLRLMGLEPTALAQGTGEEGTAFVDAAGRPVATFGVGDGEGDGPTAEMEILRGDLAALLRDAAGARVRYRFGDSVAGIAQDAAGVTVTFASGLVERYAFVAVAEGVGSATRELVFPGENRPRWMNMTTAYFTIPRTGSDDRMWRWFHAAGRRSVSLRPDRHGTARAMLTLHGRPDAHRCRDVGRQKAMLRERFADAGWETPRVLAAMADTGDFYFDVLRQVRMKRWARGRVVLTGDAAWCVTPLGGAGATLAVVGAYVLAGELARMVAAGPGAAGPGPVEAWAALAAYDRIMRPMVTRAQAVPKWVPRLFHPHSRLGVRLLHAGLWTVGRPAVRARLERLFRRGDEPGLPRYESVAALRDGTGV